MFNKLSLVGRRTLKQSTVVSSSSSSLVLGRASKQQFGTRTFSQSLYNCDKTIVEQKAQPSEGESTIVASEQVVDENKPTITSGKSYNGIPFYKPPQHIKKLSFLGVLARYTFYFVFSIWIFSGYPIYTACQFIYSLYGEPTPAPVDEDN